MEGRINGIIDPGELDCATFPSYFYLYLIQHIYEVIPVPTLEYQEISRKINSINPALIRSMKTYTGQILLVNQIYSIFKEDNIELSKDHIYDLILHLSKYVYVMDKLPE